MPVTTDRLVQFEKPYFGLEADAAPGVAVVPNINLRALSLALSPAVDVGEVNPDNSKFPLAKYVNDQRAEGTVSGSPMFDELPYILAAAVGNHAVAPALDGGGVAIPGAYQWTFSPNPDDPDHYVTYTVQQGGSGFVEQALNVLFSAFGYHVTDSDVTIDGSAIANRLSGDGVTPIDKATATQLPLVPIIRDYHQIRGVRTAYADLAGSTPLQKAFTGEFTVSDRYVRQKPIGGIGFFESKPTMQFASQIEANAEGQPYLDSLSNDEVCYFRLSAAPPAPINGIPYSLEIDMSGKVSAIAYDAVGPVRTYNLTFDLMPVSDLPGGVSITLVNSLAALNPAP